jgi:peptidoglycan-associated lipoprotein
MKRSSLFSLVVLSLALIIGGAGCKSPRKGLTQIPTLSSPPPANSGPGGPIGVGPAPSTIPPGPVGTGIEETTNGLQTASLGEFENMLKHPEILQADSVYFDFDRSNVKPGERSKVEAVAAYLKENPVNKLLIEGNCDERGTEEYNRALGERRALSLREYLVNLGVSAERIRTISYGEDRPLDPDHTPAAWAKNRRGDFVVLTPKP